MVDVFNQILKLPPEVAIVVLIVFLYSTYSNLRQDWEFRTLLAILTTQKPNAKTKTYDHEIFVRFGLAKTKLD